MAPRRPVVKQSDVRLVSRPSDTYEHYSQLESSADTLLLDNVLVVSSLCLIFLVYCNL